MQHFVDGDAQPISYLLNSMSINPISLQFSNKNVMRDNVKSLTEIKIDDNNCSYLIHRHSLSIAEGHQISQAPFVLGGNLLAISIPVIYKP